ncbi:hypothetical protein [Scytonema sp. NUACC21]
MQLGFVCHLRDRLDAVIKRYEQVYNRFQACQLMPIGYRLLGWE